MARNERLIIRHPAPKVEDDRYMLDRWTPEVTHKTRQVFRIVKRRRSEGDLFDEDHQWYRVECLCGWRSAELPRPVAETCPVQIALAERARSLKRDGERIEWMDYHLPVNESEGNKQ